jgi:MFS family permease
MLFFGMGYAVMASLPPLITGDFFEGPSFGTIFGMVQFANGLGGAVGAWFAGFIFDHTGSYIPVYLMLIGFVVFSCFNVWKAAPRNAGSYNRQRIFKVPS